MYICAYMKRQKTSPIPLKAIIASFEAILLGKSLHAVTWHAWAYMWQNLACFLRDPKSIGPKTPENIFKSVFLKIHPMFGPGTIMFTNMFGKWFKDACAQAC